jgi:two-component system response regulator NreC
MSEPIQLLIADDHEIFRDGLALMLSRQKDMNLVGQAGDGVELMTLVEAGCPDVILMDIKMPRMDGIQATKELIKTYPDLHIVALSMFSEENLIVEMLEAGAKGYLLKNADKQEILDAIHSVMENRVYYCRDTSATLASMIVKSNFNPYRKKEVVEFSERELEIIKLICKQFTAQEMGDNLFLSRRTIEGYRTRILEKMNVKNTAGVVIYALKNKLISEKELLQ